MEQVEDVKTVLRLIPLLIFIVGLFCARELAMNCYSILNKTLVYAFIIPTSLEFTIAQCPHEMRGFLVGLWYAVTGFGDFINVSGKYLFSCQGERHCQSLYT